MSPSMTTRGNDHDFEGSDMGNRESKVASLDKFSTKKGREIYHWFTQLWLVFHSKPQTYRSDEEKVAYALSYMTGATQSWAMPILQALDEGCHHELLINYDTFWEAVIVVYREVNRRSNAEDRLGRIRQTRSVLTYISMFNEHAV